VVLREGEAAEERSLRDFLGMRLLAMKVPRRILFAAELPKTAVGKPDRLRAAARLRITGSREAPPPGQGRQPRNDIEALLSARWQRVFGLGHISIDTSYFDLGGDSLALLSMLSDFERLYGVRLNLVDVLENPTIAGLAALIGTSARSMERRLYAIKPGGSHPPLFLIGGGPLQREMAELLGPDQPVLSTLLQDYSGMPTPCEVKNIAAEHIRTIRSEQAKGPYLLGGWSKHGLTAYECARQLRQSGEQVPLVIMFDSECNSGSLSRSYVTLVLEKVRFTYESFVCAVRSREVVPFLRERTGWLSQKLRRKLIRAAHPISPSQPPRLDAHVVIAEAAAQRYHPPPYAGDVLLIRAQLRPGGPMDDPAEGWDKIITGRLEIAEVPGDHRSMFRAPNVSILGSVVFRALDRHVRA
jgi:thioesterase domain-containing protein/acyl carrier protein